MNGRAMPGHPLRPGLQAWWLGLPGLTGGPLWYDLTGRRHGRLSGFAAGNGWVPSTRPGGWWSLRFDGSSTTVDLGDLSGLFTTEATVAAWVKVEAVSGVETSGLWSLNQAGYAAGTLYPSGNGYIYVSTFRKSIRPIAENSGFDKTRWHHLVISSAPGTGGWVVYQNANPILTNVGDATIALTSASKLGVSDDGTSYLKGQLDDVGVWNRALSAAEVRTLYEVSRRGYPGVLGSAGSRLARVTGPAPTSAGLPWGVGDDGPFLGFWEG